VVVAEGRTQAPLRLRLAAQSELTGRHTLANGIDLRDIQFRGRTRGAVARSIYKICPNVLWSEAERAGVFRGAPVDARDGFIHFSSATQVRETATRYFAGAEDLMLIAVDADALGDALKWEVSRGGDLFPHLYGDLPLGAVLWVRPLPLGTDQQHVFPELMP
jgi:uncharacterized protein (DUF952 family)